ncbi:MAG TPA: polysaccharide deacetylase family protein [Woeseiaceae bacterium]|nr:polysaccharide deacetylase family protein [Woeseiaceae bacterium]
MKRAVIRSGLEALYFTGAHLALEGLLGGIGAILTLHHVRPSRAATFQPNRLLEVSPEFLAAVIEELRRANFSFVSLDEMHRRLIARDSSSRFVCLTFDDGYRDNLFWAYPLLKKYEVPFAIYVPTSFPEGRGDLWWLILEDVIAATSDLELEIGGEIRRFACGGPAEKQAAFDAVYWWLRSLANEGELRAIVQKLAQGRGIDPAARCAQLCMSWQEIATLAADPLVTIGAHTVNHLMLRKASDAVVRREMAESAATIQARLGIRPAHLSYPVGDPTSAGPREFAFARELGFKTAVTTRPGVLFPEHRDHLTALPRISLNGEFQRLRYVRVLTSGAATALWNGFKRVDAA